MNNTYGTHVLLEACRMSGNIRRVINVSTDEVYGESSLGAEKGRAHLLLCLSLLRHCTDIHSCGLLHLGMAMLVHMISIFASSAHMNCQATHCTICCC